MWLRLLPGFIFPSFFLNTQQSFSLALAGPGWTVSPNTHDHVGPQNVTLLGNWVSADRAHLDGVAPSSVGPHPTAGVSVRDAHTQGGWEWRDVSVSQETGAPQPPSCRRAWWVPPRPSGRSWQGGWMNRSLHVCEEPKENGDLCGTGQDASQHLHIGVCPRPAPLWGQCRGSRSALHSRLL